MDYPVSAESRSMLSRKTTSGKTVGAVRPHAMREANDLLDLGGDDDRSPSGGEEFRPKRLPRLRIIRALPFLAVIDGGRAHD